MLDTKALAQATAAIVKEHVAAAVAPLIERIRELEDRSLDKRRSGRVGQGWHERDCIGCCADNCRRGSTRLCGRCRHLRMGLTVKTAQTVATELTGKSVTIEQLRAHRRLACGTGCF